MFDQSAFTITSQAAGGSGSWRLWHYASQNEDSLEDMLEPGYFGAMAGQIHANDFVTVTSKEFCAILVLTVVAPDVVAVEMSSVEMPEDAAVTHVQGLPGGSEPMGHTVESATDIKESAEHEEVEKPTE